MPSLNSILLLGPLTRPPAFRQTARGTPVTSFDLQLDAPAREKVCVIRVMVSGKQAGNSGTATHGGMRGAWARWWARNVDKLELACYWLVAPRASGGRGGCVMAIQRPAPSPPTPQEFERLLADSAQLKAKSGELHQRLQDLTAVFRASQANVFKIRREVHRRRQARGARMGHRRRELEDLVVALEAEVTKRVAVEEELRQYALQLRTLASRLTLAEEQEHRRVADALHEDLQQLLVGARLHLHALEQAADPAVRETACGVVEMLQQAYDRSNSLAGELSPPVLRQGQLVPALQWLARWMHEKYGFAVTLHTDDLDLTGPPDTAVLLFESIRELLLNAMKHAHTPGAQVEVVHRDGQLHVQVSDTGVGCDPAPLGRARGTAEGMGLFSIRERLHLLGGSLKIDSAPGKGCRVTLVTPVTVAMANTKAQPDSGPS